MTYTRAWLNEDANFYFGEIEGMDGQTAIIIDDSEFEMNFFCTAEQAEQLANQLQEYVRKTRLTRVK